MSAAYNPEAEQILLGAIIRDNALFAHAASFVTAEAFGNRLHQRIFAEIGQLIGHGKKADPPALKRFLAKDLNGSADGYVNQLTDTFLLNDVTVYAEEIAELSKRAARRLGIRDAGDIDVTKIPPREWLLGVSFCRKFISGCIGEGGAGKTAIRYAQYLAGATGRKDITGEHVHHPFRTLIVCLEDDIEEVERRIGAAMLHHGVTPDEVAGWIFYCTPGGLKLLQSGGTGELVVGELYDELKAAIVELSIDLVSIDPFIKAHGVGENDNNAVDQVCVMLAGIGHEFNCAVDLISHARKGIAAPGDAERDRGASAKKDAGRLMRTVTGMSEDDANNFGINQGDRHSYIRVDDAKVNLVAKSSTATGYKFVEASLGNATTDYPHGDVVHTVERYHPSDVFAGVMAATWNAILDDVDAGLANGSRYTNANNATDRAAWKLVVKHLDRTEQQARIIINTWVNNGVLILEDYADPTARKTLKGLSVNPTKRPG